MDSRLKRRSLKQSKKQLYGYLIGIVLLIFITLNFGPYLIGAVGSAIDLISGKSKQITNIKIDGSLEPPLLDPLPQATPSEFINVTGRSFYPEGEVELFVNGSKYKSARIDESLDFNIKDVKLEPGENIFKLRIIIGTRESDFSKDYKISYLKDKPKLEVDFPQDGAAFSRADQEISVRGKTDPENTVKVNDFIAIVDSEGNFSYVYKLKDGENKLLVSAENAAGQITTKEIIVSYSP
ncbi:MAG: hypothetical protein A3G66_01840 [Candidatus Levybacteria bacterium RIFCSPLOWO2_12_FULL_39_17]|nr:MAG: Bacillopeptidase F [Candidatus Levybacteria bacterium GW2011_GWA1_39_11]KKR25754.1 MAG: Bacillopeptidase F [Microgenomates group bacterium GW2011_GWC1_39_7]OGH47714.1 MAG: hypothetical protein A3G66_01840 [Candidatus Levybacteria bacterium RIFCSPLOWO2_12_FULL_39_17]